MSNPIKPTFKTEVIPILLILLSVMASFYFYANFPDQVPTHWNYRGQIDGYSPRAFAAFFFPALNLGLYILFLALPYIDPKKERYAQFTKVYHVFKLLIITFMTLLYGLVGLAGLGYPMSVSTVIPAAIGILFIILGNYMSKIKPNWFMGIRTPWTLSNEEVWNKTHRLGGKLFMIFGFFMIIGQALSERLFWQVFLAGVIIVALVPMVYSYLLYKRLPKQ